MNEDEKVVESRVKELSTATDLKQSTKDLLSRLADKESDILLAKFESKLNADCTVEDIRRQFEITRTRIKNIKEKSRENQPNPICSFCDKSAANVKTLFVSEISEVFICDGCVGECVKLGES